MHRGLSTSAIPRPGLGEGGGGGGMLLLQMRRSAAQHIRLKCSTCTPPRRRAPLGEFFTPLIMCHMLPPHLRAA